MPQAIRAIITALGPRRIVLYGSLASGLFRAAWSDIDLAVSGLGEAPPEDLAATLRELFGRHVDLVDPDTVAPFIRRDIEASGVVLHDPA